MFLDGRSISDGEALAADIAVVGSGAAGIALARQLEIAGMRTLVLESGDRQLEIATQELYGGEIVGLPYFPLQTSRLRYFGGTTNHWSGTSRPFEAYDLEVHDWIPNSGWPIGHAELQRHYEAAGEIIGLRSAQWDAAYWVGASPYPALDTGAGALESRVAQNVRARRRRLGRRFEDQLASSELVTVVLNANLVNISLTEDLDQVDRLEMRTLAGNGFSVRARAHVLAAGGLENPRLLLSANRQLPNGVGNGSDRVGRYFLEHPRFVGAVIAPFTDDLDLRFYEAHDVGRARITGYLSLRADVRTAEELIDVQFRLEPRYPAWFRRARESGDVAALRELVGIAEGDPELLEDAERVADDLTSWREFVAFGGPLPVPLPDVVAGILDATPSERAALVPELVGDIGTIVYGDMVGRIPVEAVTVTTRIDPTPNPDSRVRLGRTRDALGTPTIELDWRLDPADRASVVRAIELFGAEVGRLGIGRVRLAFDPEAEDWPADLAGGYHHMGTTRMHEDPRHGVVDATCRVHGIRDLYIAGSSVFPTAGSGTPTLTIVAMALRLAEHLEENAR